MPAVLELQGFDQAVGDNQVVTLCEALGTHLSAEASGGSSHTLVASCQVVAADLATPLELLSWNVVGSN